MAKIRVMIWKSQPNKDGTFPIYLRIHKGGKRKIISLGVSVKEEDWNDKAGQVLSSNKHYKRMNNLIAKRFFDAQDQALESETEDFQATAKQIATRIKGADNRRDYIKFAEEWIERYNNPAQMGTFISHTTALDTLKAYTSNSLAFSEIDIQFLDRYKIHLLRTGVRGVRHLNTVALHLRKIRAILNAAIERGYLDYAKNPFIYYKIKTQETHKEKLTEKELKSIIDADLKIWSGQWHARNVFFLQFYNRGIRISDVLTIRESDITENRVGKMTIKVKKYVSVEMHPEAMRIFDTYKNEKKNRKIESPYLLPFVKDGATTLFRRRGAAAAYINKELKALVKKCGITKTVSSHISRHTYAQRALDLGLDVYTIGSLLGQSSISATKQYLNKLDSKALDEKNRMVTNL